MKRHATPSPMIFSPIQKEVPSTYVHTVPDPAVALTGDEIRRDIDRFLTEAYGDTVHLTYEGQLARLYAAQLDELAHLLCLLIDRLCVGAPIHLHLRELPGSLELSLQASSKAAIPTPELQHTMLAMAAYADIALSAKMVDEGVRYTLLLREDFKVPTLRAVGGETLYAHLMSAWQQLRKQ